MRPALVALIREETGRWDDEGWICFDDLNRFRHRHVAELLRAEKGELGQLEHEVLRSLHRHEILARDPEARFQRRLTLGERLSDRIAAFGGSWSFVILFGVLLGAWMFTNSYLLAARPFDPYPYILLNLCLSCLAAIQAPLILMSQKRQESRDRTRSTHDYQVNLKAELEIRHLHQKIDHLLNRQWERLVEIQEIQMELMDELRKDRKRLPPGERGS